MRGLLVALVGVMFLLAVALAGVTIYQEGRSHGFMSGRRMTAQSVERIVLSERSVAETCRKTSDIVAGLRMGEGK